MKAHDYGRMICGRKAKYVIWMAIFYVIVILAACAPVYKYAVNMTPYPVRNVTPAGDKIKGIVLTVAAFNDVRTTSDKKRIGRVVKSDGESIPVIAARIKPADAITSGVKSYLKWAGYAVSEVSPVWDLKPTTILKEWGQFLVGGKIDTIEIICEKTTLKANYRTRVVLSMYLANVRNASILHSYTVQGESSREDINLTEDDLNNHLTIEVNNAVTDALEKLLNPKNINVQILKSIEANKT